MTIDYWICGMCVVQLMTPDKYNQGKLPGIRKFQDRREKTGLIAVRCAHCAEIPYLLEEGEVSRIHFMGDDDVSILFECNSEFNHYPLGIGHVLEPYIGEVDKARMEQLRTDPIEIGFLVDKEVNLVIVAYRHGDRRFNVTPYSWHANQEWFRAATPALEVDSDESRTFTVAYVNTTGGKYEVIRVGTISPEFALEFHTAIHEHIERGAPNWERYRSRVENLGGLLYENRIESMLSARCSIVPPSE